MSRGPGIGTKTRNRAVDLWQRGPFDGAPAIAEALCIGLGALHTLVRRTRAAGDPRAMSRPIGHRGGGTLAAVYLRLRALGMTPAEIAMHSGRPLAVVKSTLAAYTGKTS